MPAPRLLIRDPIHMRPRLRREMEECNIIGQYVHGGEYTLSRDRNTCLMSSRRGAHHLSLSAPMRCKYIQIAPHDRLDGVQQSDSVSPGDLYEMHKHRKGADVVCSVFLHTYYRALGRLHPICCDKLQRMQRFLRVGTLDLALQLPSRDVVPLDRHDAVMVARARSVMSDVCPLLSR